MQIIVGTSIPEASIFNNIYIFEVSISDGSSISEVSIFEKINILHLNIPDNNSIFDASIFHETIFDITISNTSKPNITILASPIQAATMQASSK